MICKKRVAISIGDLNGIGIQLALENHNLISKIVEPLYCIDIEMLIQASKKLNIPTPKNFQTIENIAPYFEIEEGKVDAKSGNYSYNSFIKAVDMAREKEVDAICTLPIHKKSWELADVTYKGHTDALRDFFNMPAIMMLGCPEMYVALFSEHIPLKDVAKNIKEKSLTRFLLNFYKTAKPNREVAVLGLNPHAGDDGVLGNEERIIERSINVVNERLGKKVFSQPLVPDIAFTPKVRERYTHFIAMYHDQGLAPLKALHFDEGINVSLNLPILRTSVDHGTAFDIAYKNMELNNLSYLNAIRYIAEN